jgi:hypothetical protein
MSIECLRKRASASKVLPCSWWKEGMCLRRIDDDDYDDDG